MTVGGLCALTAGLAPAAHADIDTVTNTVPVGAVPSGVAISPNGARAYVTNSRDDTVSVISISS